MKAIDITEEIADLLKSEDSIDLTVEEQQAIDLIFFSTYCNALDTAVLHEDFSFILEESVLDDLKGVASSVARTAASMLSKLASDIKDVYRKIATETGLDFAELIALLKEPSVFSLLRVFKFSLHQMLRALLACTKAMKDGLLEVFKYMHKASIFQKLRSKMISVDEAIEELEKEYPRLGPILKRGLGLAVAGLLLYMAINGTFIGSPQADFDWSHIADAAAGNYTLANLLGSPDFLITLSLYTVGTATGIGFAWLGSDIYNLALGLLYTGAIKARDHDVAGKIKPLIRG